jgi:hypothetical protein
MHWVVVDRVAVLVVVADVLGLHWVVVDRVAVLVVVALRLVVVAWP